MNIRTQGAQHQNSYNLRNEAQAARLLLEALRQDSAIGELLDEDAQLTVASETSLGEALEAVLLANALDEAHAKALGELVGTLEARMDRKLARIQQRRGAIMAALELAGLTRLELASATLSVAAGKRVVVITDQELLPAEFMVEKVSRTPDRSALGEALLAGREIAGAALSNAMPILRVRRK